MLLTPAGERARLTGKVDKLLLCKREEAKLPTEEARGATKGTGLMRLLWLGFGWICVALGLLGVLLPLLPTTPFLLLAAYGFARSSPRLHQWLVEHPTFGPPIRDWQAEGAISRSAKRMAVAAMAAVFLLSVIFGASMLVLEIQAVVLSLAAIFILTRPSPSSKP